MGIGTTAVPERLSVAGTVRADINAANAAVIGANAGTGNGVLGTATSGSGVRGAATSGSGVRGNSTSGSGVYGFTAATTTTDAGVEGVASGGGTGVLGTNTGGTGVLGNVTTGTGVRGNATSGTGVAASSTSGTALTATSSSGAALVASTSSLFGTAATITAGVFGLGLDVVGRTRTKAVLTPATGSHDMLAAAYGDVDYPGSEPDAVINSSSGNFTVTYDYSTSAFVLTFPQFSGVDLSGVVILANGRSRTGIVCLGGTCPPGPYRAVGYGNANGTVSIAVFDGNQAQRIGAFQFVMYKP